MTSARPAGEVTLSHGKHYETFKIEETEAEAAVPVPRAFINKIRVHGAKANQRRRQVFFAAS